MKNAGMILILTCACLQGQAQVNFVKNPGLEQYDACPDEWNRINYCKNWSIPGDSTTTLEYCLEYFNTCGNSTTDPVSHIPDNLLFYQFAHSGDGIAGLVLYYDNPPPSRFNPF